MPFRNIHWDAGAVDRDASAPGKRQGCSLGGRGAAVTAAGGAAVCLIRSTRYEGLLRRLACAHCCAFQDSIAIGAAAVFSEEALASELSFQRNDSFHKKLSFQRKLSRQRKL